MRIGYCTNIHAGIDVESIIENLQRHSSLVKKTYSPDFEMPIGLWFSETAVNQALQPRHLNWLKSTLEDLGLVAYTFNAFPQRDFHQPVVKHLVYQPNWAEQDRLDYTLNSISLLHEMLPPDAAGTLSTLPLGWSSDSTSTDFFVNCSRNLQACAEHLESLEQKTGRRIVLCLEPEPGCCLQRGEDVLKFFDSALFNGTQDQRQRNQRYLGLCHDVCHAAVMFEEPQDRLLQRYAAAGINVAKVQISSAIEADFTTTTPAEHDELVQRMQSFIEPRYLHQTTWNHGSQLVFFEDLPLAMEKMREQKTGIWRTHFHVPIFLQRIGSLSTTQSSIFQTLEWFEKREPQPHYEVETYAWSVSPDEISRQSMEETIGQELCWLDDVFTV